MGSPWSDGSSRPLVRRLEKSGEQASHEPRSWGRSCGVRAGSSILGQAFRLERLLGDDWCLKRVLRSKRWAEEADGWAPILTGRPSDRQLDYPSGLLCFSFLGCPMEYMLFSWAEPGRGSWSSRDPRFMNPTGAPEPPGDLSRIVRGIFRLLACTCRCSPRAPGWFGRNRLGGSFCCVCGCACFEF